MSDPLQDIVIDAPKALALFTALKAAKAALPANAKYTDYATALGCAPGSLGYQIADLAETVKDQVNS